MIQRHTLKNGVRIIAENDSRNPSASILVMIKTGSRNETAKNNGISHFLEHMAFKGTEKRPDALSIAKEIDRMGASNNAFTAKEYTGYYIKADKRYFEMALDILSDIAFNSTYLQKEIDKEKGAIIEEINMAEDTPMSLAPSLLNKITFSNIKLAQETLGKKEAVKAINSKMMRDYRDKYYVGDNTIVSCAGNLPKNYINIVKEKFSDIKNGAEDFMKFQNNPDYIKRVYLKKKPTEQAHMSMGVEAYDIKDEKKYAVNLLSTIMGENMSSRLFTEIREKRGLAYYVGSYYEPRYDTGIFLARAGLNISKTYEAVKAIKKEFEEIKNNITEEELEAAKEFKIGKTSLFTEDSMNVAEDNAWNEILGGELLTTDKLIARYKKVALDEVKNAAGDIFKPENLKLAVIGPFKNEEKFVKILES